LKTFFAGALATWTRWDAILLRLVVWQMVLDSTETVEKTCPDWAG